MRLQVHGPRLSSGTAACAAMIKVRQQVTLDSPFATGEYKCVSSLVLCVLTSHCKCMQFVQGLAING